MIVRRGWGYIAALAIASVLVSSCANPSGDAKSRPSAQDTVYANTPASSANDAVPVVPGQDLGAVFDEARAASGLDDAFATLNDRLSDICGSEPDWDECIVQHMVPAFGAQEGEDICRAEIAAGTFIDCIVNGKMLSMAANKLNTREISKQDIWGNQALAWQQMNKAMSIAAQRQCSSGAVAEQSACTSDLPLDIFEISRFDVRDCPQSLARSDCILGTAIAVLIRRSLPDL